MDRPALSMADKCEKIIHYNEKCAGEVKNIKVLYLYNAIFGVQGMDHVISKSCEIKKVKRLYIGIIEI